MFYRVPFLAASGVETDDGRTFEELSWRTLPLPLAFQDDTQHAGLPSSSIVGQIVALTPESNGAVSAIIEVDPRDDNGRPLHEDGARAAQMIEKGGQGISIDGLLPIDATVREECVMEDEDGWCMRARSIFSHVIIGGSTLTPIPAFGQAIVDPTPVDADGNPLTEDEDVPLSMVASAMAGPAVDLIARSELPLTAAAAVALADWAPKVEHFDTPEIPDDANLLTLTDDGRIYGWVAFDSCHQAFSDKCVRAADQSLDLSRWLKNSLDFDGRRIPVGFLTMDIPHAGRQLRAEVAEAHYDDTRAIVAIVTGGWIGDRIWCSGSYRPNLTGWEKSVLSVAAASGDWRANVGERERTIRASLVVPVPGFLPDREPIVASADCACGGKCGGCSPLAAKAPFSEHSPSYAEVMTKYRTEVLVQMADERIASDLATMDETIGYDPMEGLPETI